MSLTVIEILLLILNIGLLLYSLSKYQKAQKLYRAVARDKKFQSFLLLINAGGIAYDIYKTLVRKDGK